MFTTIEHGNGVESRISAHALVQEPIVVIIDGRTIELTLEDAKDLSVGLTTAINNVELRNRALSNTSTSTHTFVVGKTQYGMSLVPSKLGKTPELIDIQRSKNR